MKTKLTQKTIETQIKANEGKVVYLWDTELSGFGARLSPTGEVSWLVQKFIGGRGGRAIRQTIGRAKDAIELADARSLAEQEIGDIRKGINVVARKRQLRHKVRDQLNSIRTEEAIQKFIKANGNDTRYWSDTERLLRASLSSFMKRPIIEVSKADVRKMLDDKQGRPAAQRNLFAALRPFFSYLLEHDLIEVSPLSSISAPEPLPSRDRLLTDLELKALWESLLDAKAILGSVLSSTHPDWTENRRGLGYALGRDRHDEEILDHPERESQEWQGSYLSICHPNP